VNTTAGSLPPVSVLLVEDEVIALKLLATILAKRFPGAALYSAVNGKAGLELFKEHQPDIVITDINMPEMNGTQLARTIRMINPRVKIIVLTAGIEGLEDGAGKGVEIDYYILKPINFGDLFAALEACLAEFSAAPQQSDPALPTPLAAPDQKGT
jgi:YesN/AraC family two-component response regulator